MSSYIFKLPPPFSYINSYVPGFGIWGPDAILSGRTELVPWLLRGQTARFVFYLETVSSVVFFAGKLIFFSL